MRFEKWDEILDGKTIPIYDKPEQQAWRHWAMGLAYSATGQADKAKATLADMQKDLDAMTSAKEPIGIALQELEATIAARGGDRKKAHELYRKAADSRSGDALHRTAGVSAAGRRGLGNVALVLGDYATAEKAYREALEREPGSGRAYFGLAAALDGLGKTHRSARRAQPRREGLGERRRDPTAGAEAAHEHRRTTTTEPVQKRRRFNAEPAEHAERWGIFSAGFAVSALKRRTSQRGGFWKPSRDERYCA